MPAAQLLLNWPYDILSFFVNVLSCSSIMVFFLFNVSEKSSDALTNNESWTSFCYLYHKYDSTVPADNVISGPHFWTLRSVKLPLVIKHGHETYLYAAHLLTGEWITVLGWENQASQSLGRNLIPLHFEFVPYTSSSWWLSITSWDLD